MKFSKLMILAATLTVSMNNVNACVEGDGHGHSGMNSIPDTHELGIFDDIETLVSQEKVNSSKRAKKGGLAARLDMNFDGIDDGPQKEPFLGLPMRYPSFPTDRIPGNIGQATIHMGRPVVIWSVQDAQAYGPIIMGYFMQHEFAHHDLGHGRMPNNQNPAMREADADCNAAKSLVAQGMGHILPQVIGWFNNRGCNYDPRTPIAYVTDSHPCGVQRAQVVSQCAGM